MPKQVGKEPVQHLKSLILLGIKSCGYAREYVLFVHAMDVATQLELHL